MNSSLIISLSEKDLLENLNMRGSGRRSHKFLSTDFSLSCVFVYFSFPFFPVLNLGRVDELVGASLPLHGINLIPVAYALEDFVVHLLALRLELAHESLGCRIVDLESFCRLSNKSSTYLISCLSQMTFFSKRIFARWLTLLYLSCPSARILFFRSLPLCITNIIIKT